MPSENKRFIEDSFPVKEVGEISAKESNSRGSKISHIGLWWARRPLSVSRATAYAALVPSPTDPVKINETWQSTVAVAQGTPEAITEAVAQIKAQNGGVPPKVLDPFGGGGSLPLEAMRLGCDSYSNDYNPVAVLIQKCTLEYPQKIRQYTVPPQIGDGGLNNTFLQDLKKWGTWVINESKKELAEFYPDEDGKSVYGYIWTRVIPCPNPACRGDIPLFKDYWLANKGKEKDTEAPIKKKTSRPKTIRQIAIFPEVNKETKTINFKIVGTDYETMLTGFDPDKGNITSASIMCPFCGNVIKGKDSRQLFCDGKSSEIMIAVIYLDTNQKRSYRIMNDTDRSNFEKSFVKLKKITEKLDAILGYSTIPNENLPEKEKIAASITNLPHFGLKQWHELYNARQLLEITTFMAKLNECSIKLHETMDKEYADMLVAYIGMMLMRHTAYNNKLCRFRSSAETIIDCFAQHYIGMLFDYVEMNPFNTVESTGSYSTLFDQYLNILNDMMGTQFKGTMTITNASATELPYADNFFDAVFTDPPYYDNIAYAYLADFFYVWAKRIFGSMYPTLFSVNLSPKSKEIVQYNHREDGKDGKAFFEEMLSKAFIEIHRTLKKEGAVIVVYAHKTTAGWETLVNSLLDSHLVVTGSWALTTEKTGRSRSQGAASLSSSIYIIARKMERLPIGYYNEVKKDLMKHLKKRLPRLWDEGIRGADFFIAAIGSSIQVFGQYEQVKTYEGETIRADTFLKDTRAIVVDYLMHKVLHNGFSREVSTLTRFYVLWRFNYGEAAVEFDDVNNLARSCNLELSEEWTKGHFIVKEGKNVRAAAAPERKPELIKPTGELIDVLHKVLLLQQANQQDDVRDLLTLTGFGLHDSFYVVAQTISEVLGSTTPDSKEKKWIDSFLIGRDRLPEELANWKPKKTLAELYTSPEKVKKVRVKAPKKPVKETILNRLTKKK